jgi:hypothetical protein
MTDLEKAVKDLQDNLLVLTEIERRQSAMLREHSERIVANEEYIARLNAESAKYQRRTEQNLAEITDKLNGLIAYMDGQHRPPRE